MHRENQRYHEIDGHFNLILDKIEAKGKIHYEVYEEYPDGDEEPTVFKKLEHAWKYFDIFLELVEE